MVNSPTSALWTDRVAVVTGAATGIGAATARAGAREGGAIWILDRDAARGTELAAELRDTGASADFIEVDLEVEHEIDRAFGHIIGASGRVDILVNNAGRNSDADARTMTTVDWDRFMNLDLRASWLTARAVLPSMVEHGRGSIVNMASLHATLTAEGSFPYGAAKAGLTGLTRSLALDFGKHGVRVNTVSPGYTLSERVERFFEAAGVEEAQRIRELHALRRAARPDEVAEVVVFLASDAASYVTGANWAVDGGLGARYA